MHGDGVSRAVIVLHSVARFATILVGRIRELSVVFVLVAIEASRKLHLVQRLCARRSVALRAWHADVLAFERVVR
jgi:hypothetical protein